MGMATVDPDMLDRLAGALEERAGAAPGLKRRAEELRAGDAVTGLGPLRNWCTGAAKDLRRRANRIRNPDMDPFSALSAYGLPAGLVKDPHGADRLERALQAVLKAHKDEPPDARAKAVKDYFATLTPAQQAALAVAQPAVVGNLDGVPVDVRYAANRISIQKEYFDETEYLKTLKPDDPEFKRTKDRVDTLRGFLTFREKSYRDPETGKKVTTEVPRQFLVFDPAFGSVSDPKASPYPDGRVAEVVGDLENAQNVSFRVPGITNRLDNFNSFGAGAYDLMNDNGQERSDSAVVSWLGYDTPEIGDSVDPAKAETGGRELADFRAGISVNLRTSATVSIFAHSYGTLVTSKALQDHMNVKNVVFMGSPGLGPDINSVADFRMPNTTFYAMRAPEDPVSYTQGMGSDPADFKDITRLATDGATGHSMYYNEGTGSLKNLQNILFGGSEHLTFTHTTLDEEMTGAAEVRELVRFLHERVPQDVLVRMGADLDPIVQNLLSGRSSLTDSLGPLHAVLNRYNMLDRVEPEDLKNELVGLAGDLAYKAAYKKAEDAGAPDWVASEVAGTAKFASEKMLDVATLPVVKALEFDRLQNNVRQLFGGVMADGSRILEDGRQTVNAVTGATGEVFADVGDSVLHPTHIADNAGETVNAIDDAMDTVLDKGGDALGATVDAGKTVIDKGGDVLDSAADFLGI